MLEALKSLSVFFAENNIRTRRNLRGDIERRSLVINEEFVDAFKVVKEVNLIRHLINSSINYVRINVDCGIILDHDNFVLTGCCHFTDCNY